MNSYLVFRLNKSSKIKQAPRPAQYPLGLKAVGMPIKILKDSLEGLGRVKRLKETT